MSENGSIPPLSPAKAAKREMKRKNTRRLLEGVSRTCCRTENT